MVKNIIFDFGQVLIQFVPYEIASCYVENEADRRLLEQVVFDRKYWDRQDAGTITNDEMIASVCADLPAHLHRVAADIVHTWIYHIPPIPGMEDLLVELKGAGKNLYLLSNIGKTFIEKKDEFPILSHFDGCVFSADVGIIKPAKEIFECLCNRYGLNPAECVFIDDLAANVAAAKSYGIHALQFFGDPEELKARLFALFTD